MKHFVNLEIFKLGTNKRYETKKNRIKSQLGIKGSTECDDWCEISIATVEPQLSNIYFSHRGCLLSKACINAIVSAIENKTKEEALSILFSFRRMLSLSVVPEDLPENLKLFCKFAKFPSRRECLLLGCNLIIRELNGSLDE